MSDIPSNLVQKRKEGYNETSYHYESAECKRYLVFDRYAPKNIVYIRYSFCQCIWVYNCPNINHFGEIPRAEMDPYMSDSCITSQIISCCL